MRKLDSAELTLIHIGCEVLAESGEAPFPEQFFSLPQEIIAERLSTAYNGEWLCNAFQCREVVVRATTRLN